MPKIGQPGCMSLGPYVCDNPHHALLHHVLGASGGHYGLPEEPVINWTGGMALEFGVGDGASLRCIARYLPVVGYDSFAGLPEDWREGFPQGMFAGDPPERLPDNADLVIGLFEDTLPQFQLDTVPGPVRLLHIDCDLYSSTKTVLARTANLFVPGLIVLFDEWWGYPGCEQHEQRAWAEFARETDVSWDVIGHGIQQWAVRIT